MYKLDIMNMVLNFHKLFNVPVLSKPQLPDYDRCLLRYNLMKEELDEFKKSIDNKDIVEAADALGDLMYLIVGSVYEFGLGDVFDDIINEIHESNMSKACENENIANKTIEYYRNIGIETYSKKYNDKWIIYRCSDDKILKSIKYKKPNIKKILIDK